VAAGVGAGLRDGLPINQRVQASHHRHPSDLRVPKSHRDADGGQGDGRAAGAGGSAHFPGGLPEGRRARRGGGDDRGREQQADRRADGVLITLLAGLLARRTAKAPPQPTAQPA
jgi:hypothetical protein